MSTLEQRRAAVVVTIDLRTLKDKLSAIGITVPDQVKVKQMMSAIRIGLPPNASRLRIASAFLRMYRAEKDDVRWAVYAYDRYISPQEPSTYMLEQRSVPAIVREEVARIRQAIPGAKIRVYALARDPWLEVSHHDERYFIRGWDGDRILL